MNHTLNHAILCVLLIIATMQKAKAQCPAATPLTINSINSTESRCAATGKATVSVSGGSTPYVFSIVAGPALSLPQSSNILQSLAPGSYTVQVTDSCNTSVTGNFTVTGTYTVPSLDVTTQSPSCSSSSDGSITFHVTDGRGPFIDSLVSPSPVIAGLSAGNNVFTNLPAGNYTCKVIDSCGNFQTRVVTLNASTSSVTIAAAGLQYLGCDSFACNVECFINGFKPPYTVSLTGPDGTVTTNTVNTPDIFGDITSQFTLKYHHIPGDNKTMAVSVTNNCGVTGSAVIILDLQGFDMVANSAVLPGCGGQFAYTFDQYNDNSQFPSSKHCSTITYTLVSPTGAILATQTNNSTFSGFPPAAGYKVIRQDCCQKDSLQFDWAGGAAFHITNAFPMIYASCKEGTTGLQMNFNFNSRQGYIVVASGPSFMTTVDGTVHPLTYPDTIKNVTFNGVLLDYFTVGTYKIIAITTCGEQDSVMVTIGPGDLRHSPFSASLVKGCTNASKILLFASTNTYWSSAFPDGTITVNSIYNKGANSPSFSDEVTNLSPGTYYAAYHYSTAYNPTFLNDMSSWGCDVVTDTIVVPVYTQPLFNPAAAVALCGATRQVALLPDSTRGILPFQYQILNGPYATPLQASPAFTGLAPGTYTFLMTDACANSYSRSITIDTLVVPNVVTTGSTCIGGAAVLSLPSSPFFSYSWQRPGGYFSTGNTLVLNPVSILDTGKYIISVTSTIGGCTSTTSKSLTLSACSTLAETLLHFSGQRKSGTVQLYWQTTNEENMSYYLVERSTDGIVFTPVQRVTATENSMNNYTATDMHVPSGIVYYRLQMVETSGMVRYSPIILFNNNNEQPFNVYPSLITGNTPVTVTCPVTSHTSYIRIIGVDGRVWRTIPVAAGITQTRIDVTSLATGSYFIVFTGNNNLVSIPVWKE
ncbi:hypothetical protein Niako_1064 [Niastella koreensis GR20-10]|uniref:Ig-like domain-containing protein n=1 Tax=Niastella koreensis (strain DSM 17620 / KACC 11465 / NBRC 106392 / GR20-10) TaxID=700598 RepID=G8THL4_NIAKG|nr:hypothetical protein [Niastella koreensis]AEV97442.1 hypothetical protein Niako_1064 [Niastella koreensis GR20-10]